MKRGKRQYFSFMGVHWSILGFTRMNALLLEIEKTRSVPDVTAEPYNARKVKVIPSQVFRDGRYHGPVEPDNRRGERE